MGPLYLRAPRLQGGKGPEDGPTAERDLSRPRGPQAERQLGRPSQRRSLGSPGPASPGGNASWRPQGSSPDVARGRPRAASRSCPRKDPLAGPSCHDRFSKAGSQLTPERPRGPALKPGAGASQPIGGPRRTGYAPAPPREPPLTYAPKAARQRVNASASCRPITRAQSPVTRPRPSRTYVTLRGCSPGLWAASAGEARRVRPA